jgi:Tfp pilus assembly protein PilX
MTNTATAKRKPRYPKGLNSMYIVVFTTLLLTITTGSFIRIVLRDTIGSISQDNSQAAMDAAQTGIEMAKLALLKYHRCLTEGLTGTIQTSDGSVNCDDIVAVMREPNAATDCNIVQKILGMDYVTGSETPIGTKTNVTTDEIKGENLDQAITCVLISEEEDHYHAALSNSDPPQSKLVPLRTTSAKAATHVKIAWFARENGANTTNGKTGDTNNKSTDNAKNTALLDSTDYNTTARVSPLYVQLLQASKEFNIADFYLNEGATSNSAAVLFVPTTASVTPTVVPKDQFAASNSKTGNQPIPITCSAANNYYCSAIIELPAPIGGSVPALSAATDNRNLGASFLRLMIPYGAPYTEYTVMLCDSAACSNTNGDGNCDPDEICFSVQSHVSSTGRAGDSFSRLEQHLEFQDSKAPLPQYALNIGSGIEKNFWVTENNWGGANYGSVGGEEGGYAPSICTDWTGITCQ